MEQQNERRRVTWTVRISVKPSVKDAIFAIARDEKAPVAYLIGNAITDYVTSRSTA